MVLHSDIPLFFQPSDYTGAPQVGDFTIIARVALYEQMSSVELVALRTNRGWSYVLANSFGWDLRPKRPVSGGPLTLGAVIGMLDGATIGPYQTAYLMEPVCGGLNLLPGAVSLDGQRHHLRAATQFPVASSAYYPRLREWYAERHEEWLDRRLMQCIQLRDQA